MIYVVRSEPLKLYEVAFLLQRTVNQTRSLVRQGSLRALPNTGKLLRFAESDIDGLLTHPLARQRFREIMRGEFVVERPDSPATPPASLNAHSGFTKNGR